MGMVQKLNKYQGYHISLIDNMNPDDNHQVMAKYDETYNVFNIYTQNNSNPDDNHRAPAQNYE